MGDIADDRWLADPAAVRAEYADERGLEARTRVWTEFAEGESSVDATLQEVIALSPRDVLEVGAGWGELTARIRDAVGARVIATDLSPRMAQLARKKLGSVAVADVQALPFRDRSFDAAVANAMLYHVPDLAAGLAELARVVRLQGHLVATTVGRGHLAEVWDLIGAPPPAPPIRRENAYEMLERFFERVRVRTGERVVTFPNADEVRTYIRSSLTRASYVSRVPTFEGPFVAHSDFAVFVAAGPIQVRSG